MYEPVHKTDSTTGSLKKTRPSASKGMERSLAFADGVFAIAITLLVIEIHVPEIPSNEVSTQLGTALFALSPNIMSYASSAALIGLYWTAHHRVFEHIHVHDNMLLWLNIAFLVCVAFLPFPSALLGRYGQHRETIFIYAFCLFVTGLALNVIWWYARSHKLVHMDAQQGYITRSTLLILVAPFMFLIALAVSFVRLEIATLLFFVLHYMYGRPIKDVPPVQPRRVQPRRSKL